MKYVVNTEYYNPVLKVWQSEDETPYLKKDFTGWQDYAILIKSVQDKSR